MMSFINNYVFVITKDGALSHKNINALPIISNLLG